MIGREINSNLFIFIFICCPSINIFKLECHLIMMDNEKMTIGENIMMGPKFSSIMLNIKIYIVMG